MIRPSLREVVEALYGAWRLARLDAKGVDHFGSDAAAAIKSFFAAVILAPAHILLEAASLPYERITADAASVVVISALAYVIHWTALPVVMYQVCQVIDRSRQYCRFVAAYNWITVVQYLLVLPITLLLVGEVVPEALAGLLRFAMVIAILGYAWFTTRHALEVTGLGAVGIVSLDVAIALILQAFIDSAIT